VGGAREPAAGRGSQGGGRVTWVGIIVFIIIVLVILRLFGLI
jgi:hypothetical protein